LWRIYEKQIDMTELNEIKQKSCVDYLIGKGFELDKRSNSRYSFFLSPFRNEKTASFCVNNSKNTWFDYGAGFGGDVIRLVELIDRLDFKEAISFLSGSVFESVKPKAVKSPIKIISESELSKAYLISYLKSRRINIQIAKKYCKEIAFDLNNKTQYAIGFKNDKGGYELRNKYIKISTSPKWFTTIKGSSKVHIFEGFIDFLSLMSKYNKTPKDTCIVLNSVSFIDSVENKDGAIFYGDNDKAGDECFKKIKNGVDKRSIFKGYNDINDWIVSE